MDYGYFTPDQREYHVTTLDTPRPWMNYLSNDQYGVITSQSGAGFSYYRAVHAFKVTFAVDDGYVPRFPYTARVVYARDRDSGRHWAVNPQKGERGYRNFLCRHGMGYTVMSAVRGEIEGSVMIHVPVQDPVEIWKVWLTNTGRRKRRLSIYPFVEWFFSSYPGSFCDPYVHAKATYYRDLRALHAVNTNPENLVEYGGFMTSDVRPTAYETSKDAFVGPYGTLVYPEALKREKLANTRANAEKMVGALQIDVDLRGGETKQVHVLVGVAATKAQVARLVKRYRGKKAADEQFEKLNRFWRARESVVWIETPSKDINRQINTWGKVQLTHTQRWTRGLDRGYRDILQDLRGFTPLDPGIVRHYLIETLKHQYADGGAMRQWSEIGGPHDLRNYKDSPSWIPDTLTGYIKETGDFGILKQKVPYFDKGRATVYEHAMQAVDGLWRDRGQKNMCLMGHGDWNDALNEIGKEGKGVSVWLTCAMIGAMQHMQGLAEAIGDRRAAGKLAGRIRAAQKDVNRAAWDGGWYVYAFNDRGEPIGSKKNRQGKIHLNVQSWAIFTGVAKGRRLEKLLDVIDGTMDTPVGPLLLHPAYSKYDPGIGRITAMNPGTFENGSIYTHGACFKIFADTFLGRGNKAVETIEKILPSNPRNPPHKSTLEPFAITNFYCGPSNPTFGRALYSWYTAAPSWLMRTVTENIVGVRPEYDGLRIDPCVPPSWRRFTVSRKFRGATYEVEVNNPKRMERGVKEVKVDGKRIRGTLVEAFGRGKHRVEVVMG